MKYSSETVGCRTWEVSWLRLRCDGTRTETTFRLSAKRTIPFKSAGASVQSTTSSRGVRISGSNAGYTMFRGSVKSTAYPLHSPVSPSLSLSCAITFQLDSTNLPCVTSWKSEDIYTAVEAWYHSVTLIDETVSVWSKDPARTAQ